MKLRANNQPFQNNNTGNLSDRPEFVQTIRKNPQQILKLSQI
jgi:hypothetical protein